MTFDAGELIHTISGFIWPMFRVSGLVLSMPALSSSVVPARIKLAFVVLFSIFSSFVQSSVMSYELFSFSSLPIIFHELLIGIMIGFIFQFVFQAFIVAGQIVAMQMGLGFATMVDPSSKANVPLVGQFYLILVTLVFLVLDGHLAIIDLTINSFKQYPVGEFLVTREMIFEVLMFSTWVFKGAMLVALPAVASLLLVNIAFGVMTRAAPQINIFSIGFPLTLLMGVGILYFTISDVPIRVEMLIDRGLVLAKELVK